MKYLLVYLAVVNLLAFILCGYDKRQARRHGRRVPEKTLFAVSALGGAWLFWAGMFAFHHKTRHPSFRWGIPLLGFGWAVLLAYLVYRVLGGAN